MNKLLIVFLLKISVVNASVYIYECDKSRTSGEATYVQIKSGSLFKKGSIAWNEGEAKFHLPEIGNDSFSSADLSSKITSQDGSFDCFSKTLIYRSGRYALHNYCVTPAMLSGAQTGWYRLSIESGDDFEEETGNEKYFELQANCKRID